MVDNISEKLAQFGKYPDWLSFVQDDAANKIFVEYAVSNQHPEAYVQNGNAVTALEILRSGIIPGLLFVEISDQAMPFGKLKEIIDQSPNETRIIALSKINDITTYQHILSLGVDDYLLLPITKEALKHSASTVQKKKTERQVLKKCLIPVIGVRGGVGATTVAVNSAWLWASELKQPVCLVDFDGHHGDISVFLDTPANRGLQEILTEMDRIDKTFVQSVCVPKDKDFFILTNDWNIQNTIDEIPIVAESIAHFLSMMYELFDVLYIDMSAPMNKVIAQMILSRADLCLVVCDLTLASIRDTLRVVEWIKLQAPDLACKLVGNLTRPMENVEMCQSALEKAITAPLDLLLPYCKADMMEAIHAGQPFAKCFRTHDFSEKLAGFTHQLSSVLQGRPIIAQRTFWQNLWGGT